MILLLHCNFLHFIISGTFNAALGKPTSQSSTPNNDFSSDRAVDGNTETSLFAGSCSGTDHAALSYWQVDLSRVYRIYSLTITNSANNGNDAFLF